MPSHPKASADKSLAEENASPPSGAEITFFNEKDSEVKLPGCKVANKNKRLLLPTVAAFSRYPILVQAHKELMDLYRDEKVDWQTLLQRMVTLTARLTPSHPVAVTVTRIKVRFTVESAKARQEAVTLTDMGPRSEK